MSSTQLIFKVGKWSLEVPAPLVPIVVLAGTVCFIVSTLRPTSSEHVQHRHIPVPEVRSSPVALRTECRTESCTSGYDQHVCGSVEERHLSTLLTDEAKCRN